MDEERKLLRPHLKKMRVVTGSIAEIPIVDFPENLENVCILPKK
jgi:hypothetical protein